MNSPETTIVEIENWKRKEIGSSYDYAAWNDLILRGLQDACIARDNTRILNERLKIMEEKIEKLSLNMSVLQSI